MRWSRDRFRDTDRHGKVVLGAILASSLLRASTHLRSTAIELSNLQMETPMVGWATDWHLARPKALFGGQILHTVDGGLQWTNVTPAHVTFNEQAGPVILPHDSQADFVTGSFAVVATETSQTSTGGSEVLLSTTEDGGQHWQQRSVRMATPYETVPAVDFFHRRDGWVEFQPTPVPTAAPIGIELWRTTEGGQRWTRVYQTPHNEASLVTFNSATLGWLVVQKPTVLPLGNEGATLERTINGGTNLDRRIRQPDCRTQFNRTVAYVR